MHKMGVKTTCNIAETVQRSAQTPCFSGDLLHSSQPRALSADVDDDFPSLRLSRQQRYVAAR